MRLKKLSLLLLTAFLFLIAKSNVSAQQLGYTNYGTASYGTGTSTDFWVEFLDSLKNFDASLHQISWEVKKIAGPTEWTFTCCDPHQCYSSHAPHTYMTNTGSSTPDTIWAGQTGNYQLHVILHGKDGVGVYKITSWVTGDSANTVVTRINNVNVLLANGVNKINTTITELKMYPIPAYNTLNVDLSTINNARRIEVYNLIGSKMIEMSNVMQGKNEISVGDLNPGMYFIRVIDSKNAVLITKTFQKK